MAKGDCKTRVLESKIDVGKTVKYWKLEIQRPLKNIVKTIVNLPFKKDICKF